jgi:hypothetical protein
MEGNSCYKFSTVANYIRRTGAAPIRVAIDVGCNVGNMTRLMRMHFWEARVVSFEAVYEYYLCAWKFLGSDPLVRVFQAAITAEHRYADDVGEEPRSEPLPLKILKGRPGGGWGWLGGSRVVVEPPADLRPEAYEVISQPLHALTLDEAVTAVCLLTGASEIDYLKLDCEGSESSALGCASFDTLRKMRFIAGEYHDFARFYRVVQAKLRQTHYVNLAGGRDMGAFFAERRGAERTILAPDGLALPRPELADYLVESHPFRDEFVLPGERAVHGLSG